MSIEQLGLFGPPETEKLESPEEGREEQSLAYIPFIPGVKPQEAYLELNTLSELEQRAKSCRQCRLREGCRQVVFGEGKSDARLMLVGEGPGMDEDLHREGHLWERRATTGQDFKLQSCPAGSIYW